jgi:hypothetical protein
MHVTVDNGSINFQVVTFRLSVRGWLAPRGRDQPRLGDRTWVRLGGASQERTRGCSGLLVLRGANLAMSSAGASYLNLKAAPCFRAKGPQGEFAGATNKSVECSYCHAGQATFRVRELPGLPQCSSAQGFEPEALSLLPRRAGVLHCSTSQPHCPPSFLPTCSSEQR